MRIGLTGARGFIGQALAAEAESRGHEVLRFSRTSGDGCRSLQELDFSDLGAVVHLAGETVFGLWTRTKKRRIWESRVELTRRMVQAMAALPDPPRVVVSASGAAWYGDRGEAVLAEEEPMGTGFLAEVVRDWEAEVQGATGFARTASVRFGMVLGKSGGAFVLLRRLFRLGLGGRLGSGRQWMPWIHLTDAARLLLHCVETAGLAGPVNGCAPDSVRNADFTRSLAAAMHRPAFFPAPGFLLRHLPGGMGRMFLDSTRTLPQKALNSGFEFAFPTLDRALQDLTKAD